MIFVLVGIPEHPTVGTLPRDTHRLRDVSDRHPGLDPGDQQPSAIQGQTCIAVGDEGLRTEGDLDITHAPEGLPHVNNPAGVSPTSRPSTPRAFMSDGARRG
jgi:hypothetical protein